MLNQARDIFRLVLSYRDIAVRAPAFHSMAASSADSAQDALCNFALSEASRLDAHRDADRVRWRDTKAAGCGIDGPQGVRSATATPTLGLSDEHALENLRTRMRATASAFQEAVVALITNLAGTQKQVRSDIKFSVCRYSIAGARRSCASWRSD